MKTVFKNLKISAIASALPKNILDLKTMSERFGEFEVQRIMANTGIHSVHQCPKGMKISTLCYAAAESIFAAMDIESSSIDAIVLVTQTPDGVLPATSVILQHELNLNKEALAFDISYGCSGYIYGLYQASLLLTAGGCRRVLLCAGDINTPHINANDQNLAMLFGDGASATLIEQGADDFCFTIKTDGSGAGYLKMDHGDPSINPGAYLYMDGAKVMEFALREVPPIINEVLAMAQWEKESVGTFGLHQANKFMLNYLRKSMRLQESQVPVAVNTTGNTGSASIPLMLSLKKSELTSEKLEKVVLCGFGVGLSWGAMTTNLSQTKIISPFLVENEA